MSELNVRSDFPLLAQTSRGKPLTYLDTAATSQKPQCVIDALEHYYRVDNANVHRGVYELSQRATDAFENSRKIIQTFIHAEHAHEIIFVRGATEGINLVAQSFGRANISRGDEIVLSGMEHHANIVPWQLLAQEVGAELKIIPVLDNSELDMLAYANLLSEKPKSWQLFMPQMCWELSIRFAK